jgi:hypothetical protein
MIVFTLSMPNVGSWNGKWTAENDLHCRTIKLNKAKESELDGKNFYYDFKDGWGANISCLKMSSIEANRLRKKSKGFCGYDWMIASIIKNNKIIIEQ